ncbi:MAG: hypothetical protein ACHQLQ_10665 [Candidatus Acidiferrales bacterium]
MDTCSTKPFSTQREKLRALFDHRAGEWIPLPDIQALGIAQHGARIVELRREYARQGFQIENRMETGRDGIKRSWYRKTRVPVNELGPVPRSESAIRWSERQRVPTNHRGQELPAFELVP